MSLETHVRDALALAGVSPSTTPSPVGSSSSSSSSAQSSSSSLPPLTSPPASKPASADGGMTEWYFRPPRLGASGFNESSLHARDARCVRILRAKMLRRRGVDEHIQRLEAGITTTTKVLASAASRRWRQQHQQHQRLAVLIRGQAYRGSGRETFYQDGSATARTGAQEMCMQSLVRHLVVPYERDNHQVDVYLTVYRELGGSLEALMRPFGKRVISVTTVQQRTTPSQLLPLAAATRAFLAYCEAHSLAYTAVVVTRYDMYLKADLRVLMGPALAIDGFRLLWREAGGHWRHHSDHRTSQRTFSTGGWRGDWRRSNVRAPDALIAFPFPYTRCFVASAQNELFPIRNETRPLSFMHNMVPALNHALAPTKEDEPPHVRYLVRGQFDSNPYAREAACRAAPLASRSHRARRRCCMPCRRCTPYVVARHVSLHAAVAACRCRWMPSLHAVAACRR